MTQETLDYNLAPIQNEQYKTNVDTQKKILGAMGKVFRNKILIGLALLAISAGCKDSGDSGNNNNDSSTNPGNATHTTVNIGYVGNDDGSVDRLRKTTTTQPNGSSSVSVSTLDIASLNTLDIKSHAIDKDGNLYLLTQPSAGNRRLLHWNKTTETATQIGTDWADSSDNPIIYLKDNDNTVVVGGKKMDVPTTTISDMTTDADYRNNAKWGDTQKGNLEDASLMNGGTVKSLTGDSVTDRLVLSPSKSCLKFLVDRGFATSDDDIVEIDPDTYANLGEVMTDVSDDMFFAPEEANSDNLIVLNRSNGDVFALNTTSKSATKLGNIGTGYTQISTVYEGKDTYPRLKGVPSLVTINSGDTQDVTIQFQESDGQDLTVDITQTSFPTQGGRLRIKSNASQSITLTGTHAYQNLVLEATSGNFNDTNFRIDVKNNANEVVKSYNVTVRGN